jgi:hypothetical protein
MQNALKTTAADLQLLIESLDRQLRTAFGSERKQLLSFRQTLEKELHDLTD